MIGMNGLFIQQIIQVGADFLILLSFILSFYIFILNPRNTINRLVGIFVFFLAITNLAIILVFRSQDMQVIRIAHTFLVAFLPALFPTILIVSLYLLHPEWFNGFKRVLIALLLAFMFLSILFTSIDYLLGTNFYFTGFKPYLFNSSMIPLHQLAAGPFGWPILLTNIYIISVLILIAQTRTAFFDHHAPSYQQRLAKILAGAQVFTLLALFILPSFFLSGIQYLVINTIYIVLFTLLAFTQRLTERKTQTGRLQPRLTALILAITLPTIITLALSINTHTQQALEENANLRLEQAAQSSASVLEQWFLLNKGVLHSLSNQSTLMHYREEEQIPVFETIQESYPYISSITTTNVLGEPIFQSDDQHTSNYRHTLWFQNALRGKSPSTQAQINPLTGEPELVIAMPIRNSEGAITGTIMFTTLLKTFSTSITNQKIGETGFVYIVDERGYLISHPGFDGNQVDFNNFAFVGPVDFARRQGSGHLEYHDQNGVSWSANVLLLDNGWVVVAQQQLTEIFKIISNSRNVAFATIAAAAIVILLLTWAAMRQAFVPINSLTATAQAISNGDLRKVATVESNDEFGMLARSFNSMTTQLIELVDMLEMRVQERTQDLEKRTSQLKAAAEVSRAAASLHDLDQLLTIVTRLISESFGFYHVGIYLMDDKGEFVVLKNANSEGGQRMLEKGHKLKVGEQGIVGYVAQIREPRIAASVDKDSNHYINPDLPETRSQIALPLLSGGALLGVLDVQSNVENAFSDQDVETVTLLADQISIAISNARLIQKTQSLLETERRTFRSLTRDNWSDYIKSKPISGYKRNQEGLVSLSVQELSSSISSKEAISDSHLLSTPIIIRGSTIGYLRTQKSHDVGGWSTSEKKLLQRLADQLAVSLDSALLYEESLHQAKLEKMKGQVTANIHEHLDIDTILRTAAQEIRQALKLPEVTVRLAPPITNGKNQSHASE